jgi:hypothetical protein
MFSPSLSFFRQRGRLLIRVPAAPPPGGCLLHQSFILVVNSITGFVFFIHSLTLLLFAFLLPLSLSPDYHSAQSSKLLTILSWVIGKHYYYYYYYYYYNYSYYYYYCS